MRIDLLPSDVLKIRAVMRALSLVYIDVIEPPEHLQEWWPTASDCDEIVFSLDEAARADGRIVNSDTE